MKPTEKLQIYITYKDGAMQSWGYDGEHFPELTSMIADVKSDFPDGFLDTYKNVVGMLLVWGDGLPVGSELDATPTKELEPMCGPKLLEELAKWLEDIGVLVNGN